MTKSPRLYKSELTVEAHMRRVETYHLLQMLVSAGVIMPSDATDFFTSMAARCRELRVVPSVEEHRENLALTYETIGDTIV